MVIDEKTLPGSNITVLVNDIIRKVKHEVDPVGRKSLVEQHSKSELPRGLVGNAEISRGLSQGNVNLLLRLNLRLKYRGSIGKKLLIDIITLANRVVSEAYSSPKDI